MDSLNHYAEIVRQTLETLASVPHHNRAISDRVVCDTEKGNFVWLVEGWNGSTRVHHCLVHIEIIDGKIWVQKDRTEEGIATQLEAAGVPKENIVLGFHPPDIRPYTEYAVA
jgi:hypothetical protein